MSYILQALKKSEEQRQQALEEQQKVNQQDDLAVTQTNSSTSEVKIENTQPAYGFYGVIALIVIAVTAVVINALNPSSQAPDETQQALANQVDTLNQQIEQIGKQLEKQTQEVAVKPVQNEQVISEIKAEEELPEPIAIEAAPENVTSNIPSIEISSHIYSNNEDYRSAVVNGVRLKEKEYISKEIQLAQIKPTGIVLKVNQGGKDWLLSVSRNLGWGN